MHISVIGTGYVGLVTGVCFAKLGHTVTCCDIIKEKVDAINAGRPSIFEPQLEELLKGAINKGLFRATTDIDHTVRDSDVSFICVGTPSQPDGSINLQFIRSAAESIARSMKDGHTIIVKSTVVPGTTESLIPIFTSSKKKFHLGMNPEFLKEGSAVQDFMNPDSIVIGYSDDYSRKLLEELYRPFTCPKITVNLRTAEMIKYANNSFLATKISFINEIANICETAGIDVTEVAHAIGLDQRIGSKFLRAGAGFGGSCFPKDIKALVAWSKSKVYSPKLLQSVLDLNADQPLRMIDILKSVVGTINGKRVSVLGLAFKPDTDDVREAPSIKIVDQLLKIGAIVTVYDPKAMDNFRSIFGDKVKYASDIKSCLKGADATLLVTEWDEFSKLTIEHFKLMKSPVIIDGRRALDPDKLLKMGVTYLGIGWKNK